jgi:hypothetical protein
MTSRLSNYLESAKLAKMHLAVATKALYIEKDTVRAVHKCIAAMDCMVTAMNNVASIGFRAKPKR